MPNEYRLAVWLWVVVCVLAFGFFSYRAYQGLVVKEARAFRTGRVLLGDEAKADGGRNHFRPTSRAGALLVRDVGACIPGVGSRRPLATFFDPYRGRPASLKRGLAAGEQTGGTRWSETRVGTRRCAAKRAAVDCSCSLEPHAPSHRSADWSHTCFTPTREPC
jgi:hypothetical protein